MGQGRSAGNEFEDYDIVIDIESLKDAGKGWPILVSPAASRAVGERLKQHFDAAAVPQEKEIVVSVIGFFNKGKTFVINKIAALSLPSARQVHTRGLSFILPGNERRQNCVFLDTAGTNSPVWDVSDCNMIDKRSTELFLQKLIVGLSDVLLVVVNELTWPDQELIRALQNSMKGTKRKMIIVHNFRGVAKRQDLIALWKESVRLPYKGYSATYFGGKVTSSSDPGKDQVLYFMEEGSEAPTEHVFIAEDQSVAGKEFNDLAFRHIRTVLSQTDPSQKGIIQRIESCATEAIRQYLKNPDRVVVERPLHDQVPANDTTPTRHDLEGSCYQAVNPSGWGPGQGNGEDWSYDREKALQDRGRQKHSLLLKADAVLRALGKEEDVLLTKTNVSFDGFRILLSSLGDNSFSPQYDVIKDDFGLHVVIDLSGAEGKDAVKASHKVGNRLGSVGADRESKIHFLEIEGRRDLWYNKISKIPANADTHTEPVYKTVKADLPRELSPMENPRKSGAFKLAIHVEPNEYDTEKQPIITACFGIVQVSVPKKEPRQRATMRIRRGKPKPPSYNGTDSENKLSNTDS